MGVFDSISSYLFGTEPEYADAEAANPPKDDEGRKDEEVKDEDKDEGGEDDKDDDKEDDKEEEPEEEEEEEEEPEDPKARLEEECSNSGECKKYKSHYDHCAKRVEEQIEKSGKPEEDCVEEYFELMHCAAACAAPKLWKELK